MKQTDRETYLITTKLPFEWNNIRIANDIKMQ